MTKRFYSLFLFPIFSLPFFPCFSSDNKKSKLYRNGIQSINSKEALKLINFNPDILILDVRTQMEYSLGHIEGAVLIPYSELQYRIGQIISYSDKPVLVYCKTGKRSMIAASLLLESGFTNIYVLSSGINI